jgi:capsular polysaccharide biosynthesis protein
VNEPDRNHSMSEGTKPAARDASSFGVDALSSDDLRERLWAYEDFTTAQEHPAYNVAGAFASLGFIGASIRRTRRFWLTMAAVGVIVGGALFAYFPVSYAASTTILLKNNPGEDAVSAMQTQITMAQSQTVAANTVKALHLTQSVSSFRAAYVAALVTDQVLSITVTAPTAQGAVDRAREIGNQYLKFRASLLTALQNKQLADYDTQIPAAQARIVTLQTKVSQLQSSGADPAQLGALKNALKVAQDQLPTLESTVTGLKAEAQNTTAAMIYGSQVLNPATLNHHSNLKDLLEYAVSGLIGGLALGLGIVVVRELISDRLRRRDDIAAALGAPVRLSTGPLKASRLPGEPSRTARERDLRRVAGYLRNAVPHKQRGGATLAVIAVDNLSEIAPAVVAFVESCAKDGAQVVFADLTNGAVIATMLGGGGAGVRSVRVGGVQVVVAVPDPDDVLPSGPMRSSGGTARQFAPPSDSLLSACRQADLLITIAELDPALGGDHLATWATDAVALFTGGRTHGGRAYAVGEMLRVAGLHVTGVLIGADKTDESLGYPVMEAASVVRGSVVTGTSGKGGAANGGSDTRVPGSPMPATASASSGPASPLSGSPMSASPMSASNVPSGSASSAGGSAGGSGAAGSGTPTFTSTGTPTFTSTATPTFTSKSSSGNGSADGPASGNQPGGGQSNGGPLGRSYGGDQYRGGSYGGGLYGDGNLGPEQR